MMHIKVQYDAYNRTFTLVDREFKMLLEDGAMYDLEVPFTFGGDDEQDSFTAVDTTLAHE